MVRRFMLVTVLGEALQPQLLRETRPQLDLLREFFRSKGLRDVVLHQGELVRTRHAASSTALHNDRAVAWIIRTTCESTTSKCAVTRSSTLSLAHTWRSNSASQPKRRSSVARAPLSAERLRRRFSQNG